MRSTNPKQLRPDDARYPSLCVDSIGAGELSNGIANQSADPAQHGARHKGHEFGKEACPQYQRRVVEDEGEDRKNDRCYTPADDGSVNRRLFELLSIMDILEVIVLLLYLSSFRAD